MSDKCAMPVSKALDFADEWTDGITFYPGSDGWRVVCATLAAEVRRLRQGDGDKLPMSREQIAEELLKCFPPLDKPNYVVLHELVAVVEHVLRIGTTELREENKRLNAFLAESCQEMRSNGPYDGSGPCPEIIRLTDDNKRLRSGEFICNRCGLRKDADNFFVEIPF